MLEWNQIFIDTLIATRYAELVQSTARRDRSHGDLRRLQRDRSALYADIRSKVTAPNGASRRAAVIAAAYTALVGLFPSQTDGAGHEL